MSLSERDRKLLVIVAAVAALAAYWLLMLSPKREEVSQLDASLAEQRTKLDGAQARAAQAERARTGFASDYAAIVRLGKAIPTTVDMPSLLVQLEKAARGTNISFDKITAGQRAAAPTPAGGAPPSPGGQEGAAAAGGEPAASGPGNAAETAGETVEDANAADEASGGEAATGGGAAGAGGGRGGSGAPGLDSVPLEFEFEGSFFELADFFHELKRFVRVAGDGEIVVRGRLMTIDGFSFADSKEGGLRASVKATVYLAPQAEGATAGATPQGPAPQAPPAQAASGAATPPTAASIP